MLKCLQGNNPKIFQNIPESSKNILTSCPPPAEKLWQLCLCLLITCEHFSSHFLQLKHSTPMSIYSSRCFVNCCTSLNILSQNVQNFPSCLSVMCLSTPTRSSNKLSHLIHWRNWLLQLTNTSSSITSTYAFFSTAAIQPLGIIPSFRPTMTQNIPSSWALEYPSPWQ